MEFQLSPYSECELSYAETVVDVDLTFALYLKSNPAGGAAGACTQECVWKETSALQTMMVYLRAAAQGIRHGAEFEWRPGYLMTTLWPLLQVYYALRVQRIWPELDKSLSLIDVLRSEYRWHDKDPALIEALFGEDSGTYEALSKTSIGALLEHEGAFFTFEGQEQFDQDVAEVQRYMAEQGKTDFWLDTAER